MIGADGLIDEGELAAFDEHLRAPWSNKNPGLEIQRELDRESRGVCEHCLRDSDTPEAAHIDRYGEELDHHCQHPHNLINLCPNCHERYDRLKTISNAPIKFAKQQLRKQLMADVDMARAMQQAIDTKLAAMVAAQVDASIASEPFVLKFAQQVTGHVEAVVTGSSLAPPTSSVEAGTRLAALSGSLSANHPITSRFVSALSVSFDEGGLPPADVDIEDLFETKRTPGSCDKCATATEIDRASCSECDEDAGSHEHASPAGNGLYELSDEDVRGDWTSVSCAKCGSETFEVESAKLCSGCVGSIDRANAD